MNEEIILNQCMGIRKEETLLIVYDKNKTEIANSIYDKAKKLCYTKLLKTSIAKENGEEPSNELAEEMLNYNVILLITTKSLSHTKARRNASKKARIASMPGITEDMMSRLNVDYKEMSKRIEKVKNYLTKGDKVKILTEKGTDIEIDVTREKGTGDKGIYNEKGKFGNLPAGEAAILPKNANGVFVVDATFAGTGDLDKPIKVTVKDNYAVKIEGGNAAKRLLKIVNKFGKKARNIAELGIGMNDKAKITGNVLEDEKILGTAHIALGNNKSYGGKVDVPLHLDGVFFNPTIFVDDKKIIDNGKLI